MKYERIKNSGMTLPELILTMLMLASFTGITLMVTQFMAKFFQPLSVGEKESNKDNGLFNDDLINHHIMINSAIDSIIEKFSQPGFDRNKISSLPNCTYRPGSEWGVSSISDNAIPFSYSLCIKPSSLTESSYQELIYNINDTAKPGIYILYAIPRDGVSINAIPVRRIFCRPKPFCKS